MIYYVLFMKDALSRNELWDIVIMDPPKLAPRKKVTFSSELFWLDIYFKYFDKNAYIMLLL